MNANLLKLAALDAHDLAVVSAHAQDAVAKLADVTWSAAAGRFLMPMNRFAWERTLGRPARESDQRRLAVLHVDRVRRVRIAGASKGERDQVVSVLAVMFDPTDPPAGSITIACSGSVTLRLEVEVIEARLTDVGAVWSASMRPKHAVR